MAVELRNRLHSQFGGKFTINATAVFDYPTIGGLGEYLAAQLPDAEGDAAPAGDAAPEAGEAQAETSAPSPNGSSNGSSNGSNGSAAAEPSAVSEPAAEQS
jgi:hypothetical protein